MYYAMFFDNFAWHKDIKLKSSPKGEGFSPDGDIKMSKNISPQIQNNADFNR